MIWKIARKEFLLNLMTFKFAVGTATCVVLTAVFMPILARDYQQRLANYGENVAANEAELGNVKVYKNVQPTLYRPPDVLSVFCEGLEKQSGRSAKVQLGGISEISAASTSSNPFLSIFPAFDVTLILKVVMSILALLVAYDAVCGERELGTLKLMLSGATARYQILLAKLLAGLATLVIPITLALIVALLILQCFPTVDLSGADWVRIAVMYMASLLFVSVMYTIGLLFSCLMRRSNISLVLGLFIWIASAVVIPTASTYVAGSLRPVEARAQMDAQVRALIEERDRNIHELTKMLRDGGNWMGANGAFGGYFVVFSDELYRRDLQTGYARSEPARIEYADKIYQVQQQYLRGRLKQKRLASTLAQFSPVAAYESLMSALAGTDIAAYEHFRSRVRTYADEVAEYIRSRTQNFFALSYFTPTREEDQERTIEELGRLLARVQADGDQRAGAAAIGEWRRQKLEQTPSLNLQDLPRFVCGHEALAVTLHRTVPHLALMVSFNVLFFALAFVAFLRYDAR